MLQLAFFAGPLLVIHAYEAWRNDVLAIFRLPILARVSVMALVFYATVLLGEFGGAQFIYFRF